MGREVRMVPKDWQHPKDEKNHSIPLMDSFCQRVSDYYREDAMWDIGFRSDFNTYPELSFKPKDGDENGTFFDWDGPPPVPENYMPDWATEARTHFQMYETCSEGTPISPVMETPEELAQWLADNNASSFGNMTATYKQWLSTIHRGWAISAVMVVNQDGRGIMESGVAGLDEDGKIRP